MKRTLLLFFVTLIFIVSAAIDSKPIISIEDVKITGIENTATANITITFLPEGLAGYNITVSLSNSSVAEIIAVEFPSWAVLHANSSLPSNQVWIKAIDLNNEIKENATNVTLATITVRPLVEANTTIYLQVNKLDDDEGYPINAIIKNATLKILYLPPLPGISNPPTDPDNDGLFEDLNGNGNIDFNDVVEYFQHLEWIEENYPVEDIDFNGNGLVDFDDIVELFMEV